MWRAEGCWAAAVFSFLLILGDKERFRWALAGTRPTAATSENTDGGIAGVRSDWSAKAGGFFPESRHCTNNSTQRKSSGAGGGG